MRDAGRPFDCIGQLLVCLGNLQVAIAEHRIACRFRLVAGVPSLSSIPTAVALLTHWSSFDGSTFRTRYAAKMTLGAFIFQPQRLA